MCCSLIVKVEPVTKLRHVVILGVVIISLTGGLLVGPAKAGLSSNEVCATITDSQAKALSKAASTGLDQRMAVLSLSMGIVSGMQQQGNERSLTTLQIVKMAQAISNPFFGASAAKTSMTVKRKRMRRNCKRAMDSVLAGR